MWLRFLIIFLVACLGASSSADAKEKNGVAFIIKASPDSTFQSQLWVENDKLAKEILKGKVQEMERIPELPYAYLEVRNRGNKQMYMVSYSLNLFDVNHHSKIQLPIETKRKIKSYLQVVHKKHYGDLVTWQEAATIFARKDTAQIIDLETGLHFDVQRRAGSQHADVQPLTKEDTAIMKRIYSGKWSWKRRAILVKVDGHTLAASMHGMPHGAGAITWNNFPGHFCIHFKNSTTHRRKFPDPGHDLMISKASGQLLERIVTGSPEEVISLFVAAINEQDESVIKLMLDQSNPQSVQQLLSKLDQIEGIRIQSFSKQTEHLAFSSQIPVEINILRKGRKEETILTPFLLQRNGLTERWKLDLETILTRW